ncbi:MAG: glucose-1-phosphate thymidylyltransferase RfbA [Deltaproteobacteria bacterium]|nr:glucose-1-phosphate thymidylyltransferase RfbA [Deltaproteobacteria bacterium]
MTASPRVPRVKGILLAGGTGTRLWPLTRAVSKQLLPVYDKPMIYHPLSTLMLAGIRDILIITTPADRPAFEAVLGDGTPWGLTLDYAVQPRPDGIAQALIIAEPFLAGHPAALVLGDNLFYGHGLVEVLRAAVTRAATTPGATIFGTRVSDPERYGVAEVDGHGRITSLVEKPNHVANPAACWAVTGLYFYDRHAPALARTLTPSARGELEITDLNARYLERDELELVRLGRGFAWLDTGTHDALLEAGHFVATLQRRQGLIIASPEEVAFRQGWIDAAQLARLAAALGASPYGRYLALLAAEGHP